MAPVFSSSRRWCAASSSGALNHPGPLIELAAASSSDAGLIRSLLDGYLHELGNHGDLPIATTDSVSYPYLDLYWSEPGRHAFIIQCGRRAAGCALVRGPTSTGSAVHQLAEFYIKHGSRRLGIGRRALFAIWKRFPGQWELNVHKRNVAALQFWASCIEAATNAAPQLSELRTRDGRHVRFNFHVEHRG